MTTKPCGPTRAVCYCFALIVANGACALRGAQTKPPTMHTAVPTDALLVVGARNEAWHVHAGAPALIGMAHLEVEHHSAKTVSLTLEEVLWLRAHCTSDRWDEATPLIPAALTIDEGRAIPAAQTVSVPAGRHRVTVSWEPVFAYQACDRFAVRMTFRTASGRQVVEVPFEVMREDVPHE